MSTILFPLVSAAVFTAVVLVRNLYIFQLNHYIHPDHWRWMLESPKRMWPSAAAVAGAAAGFFGLPGAWAGGTVLLLAAFASGKAFHKLKFTRRAKTLLTTALAVEAAAAWCLAQLMPPAAAFGFACGLIPWWVLLADRIDWPLEHCIRAFYVNDAKKLLARNPELVVIGVTGSYGKTSMKYFLSSLLGLKFNVLMPPGSCNTPMGIVKFVREHLTLSHEVFVCEMGARRTGEIREICDIVRPRHAVITAVGEQHLETFKSVDNILRTKFELADAAAPDGMVFLNGDNERIRGYSLRRAHLFYGCGDGADWRAEEITETPFVSFTVRGPGGVSARIETRLLGRHNIINLVGAVAVADYLGVPLEAIAAHAPRIKAPAKRLALTELPEGIFIDDAFNSNPEGCLEALLIL